MLNLAQIEAYLLVKMLKFDDTHEFYLVGNKLKSMVISIIQGTCAIQIQIIRQQMLRRFIELIQATITLKISLTSI